MRRWRRGGAPDAGKAAAAARWKVPIGEVESEDHEVVHRPTGRRLGYGSLAKAAAGMPVPARDAIRLKDPAQFAISARAELKLVDGQDIATGKAQYGIDTRLPACSMRWWRVRRCTAARSRASTPRRRRKVRVYRVVQIEGESSAAPVQSLVRCRCCAEHWAAMQGRRR